MLGWFTDPRAHVPPRRDGDLVADGVCVPFIAEKVGVAQPAATAHPRALAHAGWRTARRVGQWRCYRRDEDVIAALARRAGEEL